MANYRGAPGYLAYEHAAVVTDARWAAGEPTLLFAPAAGGAAETMVSSLNPRHVDSFGHGAVMGEQVPALDWPTLLRKHGARAVGTLLVDAEGLDCLLLLDFPFGEVLPDVVMFEHCHCAPADERRLTRLLTALGYAETMRTKDDAAFALRAKE